jgi:flavin-dependent dehydrogenase
MGHVDVLSSGFMWVTTTGDSRSSVGVSCALLSSRKLPPAEETLPNTYSLGEKARRVRGL